MSTKICDVVTSLLFRGGGGGEPFSLAAADSGWTRTRPSIIRFGQALSPSPPPKNCPSTILQCPIISEKMTQSSAMEGFNLSPQFFRVIFPPSPPRSPHLSRLILDGVPEIPIYLSRDAFIFGLVWWLGEGGREGRKGTRSISIAGIVNHNH